MEGNNLRTRLLNIASYKPHVRQEIYGVDTYQNKKKKVKLMREIF
jgi:hypothetical protein